MHDKRNVAVFVHSDDLTATVLADALDWYEEALGAEHFVKINPGSAPVETT